MKFKVAMHDDPNIQQGFLTRTLIVTGTVDPQGFFRGGKIHVQCFGETVEKAEALAERIAAMLNAQESE